MQVSHAAENAIIRGGLKIEDDIIVIPTNDPEKSAKIISDKFKKEKRKVPTYKEDNYESYIFENENLFS